MAEHPGFLQAIIDDPDDDLARLVYADWLEEHDDPVRAEFIRVQDELARHAPQYAPRRLVEREAELQFTYRRRLLAPFIDLGVSVCTDGYLYGADRGLSFGFRRGFVEEISAWGAEGARQFVGHAEALFALGPLLHLRFSPWPSNDYVAGDPFAGGFDPIELPTFRALLALPQLRRLRSLDLRHNGLRDDEGRALGWSQHLTPRTRLFLFDPEPPWMGGFGEEIERALRDRFGDDALDNRVGRSLDDQGMQL
jgi:uncharacterized protein (TIGR02996 family)